MADFILLFGFIGVVIFLWGIYDFTVGVIAAYRERFNKCFRLNKNAHFPFYGFTLRMFRTYGSVGSTMTGCYPNGFVVHCEYGNYVGSTEHIDEYMCFNNLYEAEWAYERYKSALAKSMNALLENKEQDKTKLLRKFITKNFTADYAYINTQNTTTVYYDLHRHTFNTYVKRTYHKEAA